MNRQPSGKMLGKTIKSSVKTVQRSLKNLGVAAYPNREGYHYVPDLYGRSSHKQVDVRGVEPFGSLAKQAIGQGRSQLYYDRLYTVYQAMQNVGSLVDPGKTTHFAEVGVYKGGTSHFIASSARSLKLENIQLHAFDTFEGHAPQDVRPDTDPYHRARASFNDAPFADVQAFLASEPVKLYRGRFQDQAHHIENLSFHFVHLDVDLYEPTVFALRFFDKRLAPGGVMVVDDYGTTTCPGVEQAVREFLEGQRGYFVFHPLTAQCVLVKR